MPDHRRSHAVLAHAVVRLAAAGRLGGLLHGVGELRPGVAGEVGGAGDEPGEGVDAGGEHLADRLARGDLLALGERRQRRLPAVDPAAAPGGVPLRPLVGVRRLERLVPALVVTGAAFAGELAVGGDDVGR